LKDAYGNNILDVPDTNTFEATLVGNNMDPLEFNVQSFSGDNSGESTLIISIDNGYDESLTDVERIFERLVPANNYKLNVIHMKNDVST